MKGAWAIMLYLLSIIHVEGLSPESSLSHRGPKTFKQILDWVYGINILIQEDSEAYRKEIEEVLAAKLFFKGMDQDFSWAFRFFNDLCEFRRLLLSPSVDEEHIEVTMKGTARENINVFLRSFDPLNATLYILQQNLDVWVNDEDSLRGAKVNKITDSEPFQWFKLHGFKEEELNSVPSEVVKQALERFYNKDGSFVNFYMLYAAANYPGSPYTQSKLFQDAFTPVAATGRVS